MRGLASIGGALALALLLPGAALAQSPPTIPEEASELIACDTAGQLRDLGLLTVTGIRDDRPIAVIRARGELLWGRWTPAGQDVAKTTGPAPDGAPAPLLELVVPSEPGCWIWNRDPGAVLLIAPGGLSARGVLSDEAVAEGLKLDASSFQLAEPAPSWAAPQTAWTPQAVGRYLTSRVPVAEAGPNDGALNPNAMVRNLLGTCPTWRPGVTLAVANSDMALFCPGPDPKAELDGVAAVYDSAGGQFGVVRTGDSLVVEAPFVMLPRVAAVAGGLVFTNSAELIGDLMTEGGEPWWGEDAPTTGVLQRTPDALIHLERAEALTRAELVFERAFNAQLMPIKAAPIDSLAVRARVEGGVVGGEVKSIERRKRP